MKYVYATDGIVREIIPEINPAFPGIPIEERYTADFLDRCIVVSDDTEVEQNWICEGGSFTPPPEPEPENDEADEESAETEE